MKTENHLQTRYQQIVDLGRQRPWILILGLIYVMLATFALSNPQGFPISNLDSRYAQFGLSLISFLLLLAIGIHLLFNNYRVIWGCSFILYATTFLGLSLQAGWGFEFTDMSDPIIFLLWRTPMVLFVAGMWIGVSSLFKDNRVINYVPAILIAVLGSSWFFIGLVLLENIELTMYGFLFGAFIPMIMFLAYLWYRYNQETTFTSSSMVSLGFLLMGLVYSIWIPWSSNSFNPIYFILFTLFNVSLVLILKGFSSFTQENLRYGTEC